MPVEVGAEALVRQIRAFRPHVMTTYNEEGGYPHPDHMMCHNISVAAFDLAADPEAFPDAGDPWQPLKLYYDVGFSLERFDALDEAMTARGLESPFEEMRKRWAERAEKAQGRRTRASPTSPPGSCAATGSSGATRR